MNQTKLFTHLHFNMPMLYKFLFFCSIALFTLQNNAQANGNLILSANFYTKGESLYNKDVTASGKITDENVNIYKRNNYLAEKIATQKMLNPWLNKIATIKNI